MFNIQHACGGYLSVILTARHMSARDIKMTPKALNALYSIAP